MHFKISFTGLLVASLLSITITWRVSNNRTVTTGIPASANPNTIRQLLQDQPLFIRLNPVVTDIDLAPTAPERYEDEWLKTTAEAGTRTAPIQTYLLSQVITLMPGAGGWGQKHIHFETWLRDTPTGVKTRADAPFGVSVASHWAVEPTALLSDPPSPQGPQEWRLTVQRRITCVWWMMPFVAYTYDEVHASVIRDLIELAS
ncbi:uncharacterized protein BO72DRAFT_529477 [Aspergillus fijiensis CBS 313.89]|uniref:DUF7053 domain-containing protein n=1 Tax=Aspergillus fijiensis CBS 313.89 TaxID=1448319 RepID=A0A8G1RL79_9EURO|nr:uncharacterized protein BO72DRAFT_529477 [Aspergillus fijiensis CBS 313.89]RAK75335.1 hypothetical protein BO72DRAFT_529477 [Aspergillus fijiensis CBS 313.89]